MRFLSKRSALPAAYRCCLLSSWCWLLFSSMTTTTTAAAAAPTTTRHVVAVADAAASPSTTTTTAAGVFSSSSSSSVAGPFLYTVKTGIAGGIAGASGTTLLYPFDSAKTLRQSSPDKFPSVTSALKYLVMGNSNSNHHGGSSSSRSHWHLGRAYKGLWTSAIGAIPSSALYFGAYETSKTAIRKMMVKNRRIRYDDEKQERERFHHRLLIHSLAAASGNVLSSAVFVPKELIKQQMQYQGTKSLQSTIQGIVQEKGIAGLYCGYKTVLLRNIPTAALRFCLYEEFRRKFLYNYETNNNNTNNNINNKNMNSALFSWRLFAAGAMAGAIASGVMTPVDVLKTRMSTGLCAVEPGITGCMLQVMEEAGWQGLYAGAGSRIVFSAAFTAIGFGMFEVSKKAMGISDLQDNGNIKIMENSKPGHRSSSV